MTCTNSQGKCDASMQPRAEEPCEDYSGCYEWKTGDWSKVSRARWPSCPGPAVTGHMALAMRPPSTWQTHCLAQRCPCIPPFSSLPTPVAWKLAGRAHFIECIEKTKCSPKIQARACSSILPRAGHPCPSVCRRSLRQGRLIKDILQTLVPFTPGTLARDWRIDGAKGPGMWGPRARDPEQGGQFSSLPSHPSLAIHLPPLSDCCSLGMGVCVRTGSRSTETFPQKLCDSHGLPRPACV